jgi:UDP-glucose 6-dehydrogenase
MKIAIIGTVYAGLSNAMPLAQPNEEVAISQASRHCERSVAIHAPFTLIPHPTIAT